MTKNATYCDKHVSSRKCIFFVVRISINMIQSYSCSTQTPNNIYFWFNTNPEGKGIVRWWSYQPWNHFQHTSSPRLLLVSVYSATPVFELLLFSNWTSIKYWGVAINTSKVHINNMYIKYTFVHLAILLIRQILGAVPLPVSSLLAVEALSFRLRSSCGLLHESGNLLVILLEVPFLLLCPFSWN